MGASRGTVAERLDRLSMPEPNSGCVLWLGYLDPNGYGRFRMRTADGKWVVSAYLAAYLTFVGPVPAGLVLDHLCRNHACIAYWHLEAVTQRVNLLRGITRASRNASKVVCINGHPYDENNTYVRPDGRGRDCNACRRAAGHRQREQAAVS